MARNFGRRNFFSKVSREQAIEETRIARLNHEAEFEAEMALLKRDDEDLSRERTELIKKGLEFMNLTLADQQFFSQLKKGEVSKFTTEVPEDCDALRKLSITFDRKLERSNQKESSANMAQVDGEYSKRVNQRMKQIKIDNKRKSNFNRSEIKTGGTTDMTTATDEVNVDKIKNDFELSKWKKHRIYLDLKMQDFKSDFDQFNQADKDFLKAVYHYQEYEVPLKNQFFRKYAGTIVYIPSGGGKSTLYNKYKNIFFDIDMLLWYDDNYTEFSFLFNMAKETNDWRALNGYWQRLVFKYKNIINGRILLSHHPDQIPPKLRKICDEIIFIPLDAGGLREFDSNKKSLLACRDVPIVECKRNQMFYLALKYSKFKKHTNFLKCNKSNTRIMYHESNSTIEDNNSSYSDSISLNVNDSIDQSDSHIIFDQPEQEYISWDDPRLEYFSRSELAKIDYRFNNPYYDPRFE